MTRPLLLLLLLPWMAAAGTSYDSMTSDQLGAELARVQARLAAAAQAGKKEEALALGEELKAVAKAYGQSFMRGAPQKRTPAAPPDPAGAAAGAERLRRFRAGTEEVEAMLGRGEVERALNTMEAVVADSFGPGTTSHDDMARAGLALTLAQTYLDLLVDADRSLALSRDIEALCERRLGSSPDLADLQVRTWIAIRQGARNQIGRALAALGRTKELQALAEESAQRWEVLRAAYTAGKTPPYSALDQAFLYGGVLNLSNQLLDAGDALAGRRGKEASAAEIRGRVRTLLEGFLATLPQLSGPMAHFSLARRATCLGRLAHLYEVSGEAAAAREAYEEYLELVTRYHQLVPTAPPFDVYARARLSYAELLRDAGEAEAALAAATAADEDFEQLKRAAGAGLNRAELVRAWRPDFLRATVHEAAGRTDQAIAAYQETIETFEGFYASMRSGQLKGAFLRIEECGEAYRRLVGLLLSAGREDEALAYLERSKSAVLLDMLRSLPLRKRQNWPKELLEREQQLKEELHRLRRGAGPDAGTGEEPSGTRGLEADGEALSELRWEYELLLREVSDKVQRGAGEAGYDQVWYRPPGELARASADRADRVVVSYFDDGAAMRVFVLRAGELTVHECGPSQKLSRAVSKLRRNIASRSSRWERPARDLYQALVSPWWARAEGAGELVVVPTGFLYALPFACLAPADELPLGARVPLSVTSQASLVADEAGGTPLPRSRLVVGDPDGSLPSARIEAAAIAAACPDPATCQLLVGDAARESTLKRRLGHLREGLAPGVVHLATHGLLERGRELFSTLVLAPDEREDGTLSVAEIFSDLNLLETPVVVLSACNTALGAEGGGDEIVGLSRAFQYAGARWVVASLWEVSDEASAHLMQAFHRALGETGRVDQALGRAMAATREAREEWSHPYYWAPFAAFRR